MRHHENWSGVEKVLKVSQSLDLYRNVLDLETLGTLKHTLEKYTFLGENLVRLEFINYFCGIDEKVITEMTYKVKSNFELFS